jgi:hypothetical protein
VSIRLLILATITQRGARPLVRGSVNEAATANTTGRNFRSGGRFSHSR